MNILFLAALAILCGQLGGEGSRRIKTPQVVGFIIIGVLLGPSVFHLIRLEDVEAVNMISSLTLGIIGFGIGQELKYSALKSLGKSILSIVVFEAFGAFLLVGIGVSLLTGSIPAGLIFGALASATAPAATVDVLYEYKSKGPLTSTLLAVVGIDDAIALILYGFAASLTQSILTGGGAGISLQAVLIQPFLEIGGSILVGFIIGFLFGLLTRKMRNQNKLFTLTIGTILLACGISRLFNLSLILTNMTFGIVLINYTPAVSRRITGILNGFTPPLYIFFFALVGARLQISMLPHIGLIGILYIVLRSAGKFAGTFLGAKISNATEPVKKYLGFALFSQAGVAIGLAISASNELAKAGPAGVELGAMAINIITATTFVVQLIGPPFVKYAIVKAKEVGKAESSFSPSANDE